jgi:sigma-B regulation protein RsbU (phosphoserine phosphatase)
LTGYNLPSKEVGGDYFDFITLDENRLGIAIGDIAGKGIPAALLMSNLQAALRISALRDASTDDVVRQINTHITKTTTPEKFATFFYGVFDINQYTLQYTNAGHNYPILCRADGLNMLKDGGVIIGLLESAVYKTEQVHLSPGDSLVLYTDGITEALNPDEEEFGEHRLLQTIKRVTHLSAQHILDHILECVIDFTHGHLQSDDITLAVLKVK